MAVQTITSAQCAAEIMTVVPAITRFLRSKLRCHGQPHLSLSQLRVLHFLQRQPQSSLSAVANYLDVTRPTMSAIVERLVQRGLVQRSADPHERRRLILSLTQQGATEMDQVYRATCDSIAHRIAQLSDEQRHQAMVGLSVLEKVFANAND